MSSKQHRKIGYSPGMISLLCIPLLLVFFTHKRLAEQPHYHATVIYWNNDELLKFWKVPERQYIKFILNSKADTNNFTLKNAELRILDLIAQEDTIHGIQIQFGSCSKYKDFVAAIDMLNIDRIECYTISDNGIKVFYKKQAERNKVSENNVIDFL